SVGGAIASPRDTLVASAIQLARVRQRHARRGLRTCRRSTRGGSSPTRRGNSVPRGDYNRRLVRDVAPRIPAFHAFRGALESFCAWRKFHRFHDKLLVAAIQHQVADLGDLTFNNGVMFAPR